MKYGHQSFVWGIFPHYGDYDQRLMEAEKIESELLGFVRREIFAPAIEITPETDLVGAGFDSMSLVRVLLFLETTYGLWIPEKEITGETLKNLRSLAAAVARLLHER